MKRWQKSWLYGLLIFSLLHILRDVFQDLGIRNTFSTILTKQTDSSLAFVLGQTIVNTYIVAPVEIGLSTISLYKKKFGTVGYVTIGIMAVSFSAWLFYWLYL